MVRLEEMITVGRPAAEVFAYLAAFETVAQWDPSVREARALTASGPGVGAAYDVVATFRGREIPMRYETVEYAAPERIVLVGSGANIHATDTIICQPRSPETTRIVYRADFRLSWPWRLLEPVLRPSFRRLGEAAMRGMERELGGPVPDDAAAGTDA